MYKIVTFTDIHLADRGPLSRKDNYRESIFNKLEQIKCFCEDEKVDLAICGGDIFDRKTPSKNSHSLVSEALMMFKSFPCPVYTVIGNHDILQDNITNLNKQPLYTLIKSGALRIIRDEFFHNNLIRVFGVDYLENPGYDNFNKEIIKEKIQICVSHVNASCTFDNLFGERVYSYKELAKCSPNIFVFGHYHPDQNIEILNNKYFINVGSLSRGSLKKDELERTPAFGYIEIDDSFNIKCEKKRLDCLCPNEVFDLVAKEKEDKEYEEIENFVKEMSSKISIGEDDNIVDKIRSLNFEKEIVERALYYYDNSN